MSSRSAPLFQPGEIAIVRGLTAAEYLFLNETECTVLQRETYFRGVIDGEEVCIYGYAVENVDRKQRFIASRFLHKKRPPAGSWSALRNIWQPKSDHRSDLKAFAQYCASGDSMRHGSGA